MAQNECRRIKKTLEIRFSWKTCTSSGNIINKVETFFHNLKEHTKEGEVSDTKLQNK